MLNFMNPFPTVFVAVRHRKTWFLNMWASSWWTTNHTLPKFNGCFTISNPPIEKEILTELGNHPHGFKFQGSTSGVEGGPKAPSCK